MQIKKTVYTSYLIMWQAYDEMASVKLQNTHVLLAPEKYRNDLAAEIRFRKNLRLLEEIENLYWIQGDKTELWWPQWQLWNVQEESVQSISQATKFLKSKGKYWLNLDFQLHRRSFLIQDGLPKIKFPPIERGTRPQIPQCGAWFLKEANTLVYSTEISLNFPNGIINLIEDKGAPSRAFNKLDEVFVRLGQAPKPNETVIDLGSHPGGWTWVLSHYAKKVLSVDTVPLDKKLDSAKNVHFIKKDAFKLDPKEVGPIDWFFSDIICEPTRLRELVFLWRDSGLVKNFVCSIKFKGDVNFSTLNEFQKIPNSKIFHQNANKHELTWVNLK